MNAAQTLPIGVLTAAGSPSASGESLVLFRRLLECAWAEQAPRLAAMAAALGLAREQVADVLQEVYLMALARPPAISDRTELARWLTRVTANRAHLEHRRRSRWRRLWNNLARAWRTELPAAPSSELIGEVERALATLDDGDRALVAMRYFSELNSREIAEIVGIPESTVRGRLRAARRKLALELAGWNDD
jgi:RNA polymerase sigma-70 factor (ECF subfamily)